MRVADAQGGVPWQPHPLAPLRLYDAQLHEQVSAGCLHFEPLE